ncbi:hypothetical protein DIPPA_01291 [Diplonema papillatum]|nr:hypothetical protein DIPPA_01291 [Diplonema papillatum]
MTNATAAGAALIPSHVAMGTFKRGGSTFEETCRFPTITKKKLHYTIGGGAAQQFHGVTVGEGELYGAMAPDTGRGGGLENKPSSNIASDFHHIPNYAGHRPEGWTPHYGRKHWGNHETKKHSKGESHICSWGRPAKVSGMSFSTNQRLLETGPVRNARGLFKAEVEDVIDECARSQMTIVGDTAYASLRHDRMQMTLSGSNVPTIRHEPAVLTKTLAAVPDGYALSRASPKDLAIFQGTFPSTRHVPGFSGHISGGLRRPSDHA